MAVAFNAALAASTLTSLRPLEVRANASGLVHCRMYSAHTRNEQVTNEEAIAVLEAKAKDYKANKSDSAELAAKKRSVRCKLRSKIKEWSAPRVNGVLAVSTAKPAQTPEEAAKLAAKRARATKPAKPTKATKAANAVRATAFDAITAKRTATTTTATVSA